MYTPVLIERQLLSTRTVLNGRGTHVIIMIAIIVKEISIAPVYHTEWERRALKKNIR